MATSSTAGVDLSSQDRKTASCVITWSRRRGWVSSLDVGITDEAINLLLTDDDIAKTGLDVPFGWPTAFADAVFHHSKNGNWPSSYRHADIRAFRFRRTDIHVWQQTGLWPLSVSTDRIGIPTMRAAAFLSAGRVPLDGSGRVVEVYPAVALRQWDLPFKRYKGENHRAERAALLAQVVTATLRLAVDPAAVPGSLRALRRRVRCADRCARGSCGRRERSHCDSRRRARSGQTRGVDPHSEIGIAVDVARPGAGV